MAYTRLSLANYPNIIEVMNLVGCGVRQDIDWDGETSSERKDLFWFGDEPEPAAGLHGFCASPPFHTLADLDAFCASNLTQYDAVASEIDRTNAYPETWFWQGCEEVFHLLASLPMDMRIRDGADPLPQKREHLE